MSGSLASANRTPALPWPPPLEPVCCNHALVQRLSRPRDPVKENRAILSLAHSLKDSRKSLLQDLVEVVLDLCGAYSSGIRILEEQGGQQVLRWHAIAGEWPRHLGGVIPREMSPSRAVLDGNTSRLLTHPKRHFPSLREFTPQIVEALLIPFHFAGRPIGTIWVVAHNNSRRFDAEDERLLSILEKYAATAYELLTISGSLKVLPRRAFRNRECPKRISTFSKRTSGELGIPLGVRNGHEIRTAIESP